MSYIVVKIDFDNKKSYNMSDSIDGILYEDFGRALQQSKVLNVGVAEIGYYAAMKEINNEKTGNDKKD